MSCEFDIRQDRPAVSVLTITYNHALYIRECLDGIVSQRTNFPFELIIHDDASTDGTAEIVREYAEKYPHIIIPILQEENQWSKQGSVGPYVYPLVRGKYIALCEGDDYWINPLKLQKQVDVLDAHPECSFCGHNTLLVTPGEDARPMFTWKRHNIRSIYRFPKRLNKRNIVKVHPSSRMFRVVAMDVKNSQFKRSLTWDSSSFWYLLSKGALFYIDEIMSVYRYSGTGVSSGSSLIRQRLLAVRNMLDINEELGLRHNHIFMPRILRHSDLLELSFREQILLRYRPHAAHALYQMVRERVEANLANSAV